MTTIGEQWRRPPTTIQKLSGSSLFSGTTTFMPSRPAMTEPGSSRTVAIVRIFTISFVRWAVRVMNTSKDPRSAWRLDSTEATAASKREVTAWRSSLASAPTSWRMSGPDSDANTVRWRVMVRRSHEMRRRSRTRSSRMSSVADVAERPGVHLVDLVVDPIDRLEVARHDGVEQHRHELGALDGAERRVRFDPLVDLVEQLQLAGVAGDDDVLARHDVEPQLVGLAPDPGLRGDAEVEVRPVHGEVRPARGRLQRALRRLVELEALPEGLHVGRLDRAEDVDPRRAAGSPGATAIASSRLSSRSSRSASNRRTRYRGCSSARVAPPVRVG